MDLRSLLYVGLGSAVGGMLRFAAIHWVDRKASGNFPLSVLAVNVLGSFAIGLLLPLYAKLGWDKTHMMPLMLSVGMLGGFTTFSTFSLQTLRLIQLGHWGMAGLNALVSVAACLLAVFAGWRLGEALWGA